MNKDHVNMLLVLQALEHRTKEEWKEIHRPRVPKPAPRATPPEEYARQYDEDVRFRKEQALGDIAGTDRRKINKSSTGY
jgi:hypothetical protein